jgi:hypothetical protein
MKRQEESGYACPVKGLLYICREREVTGVYGRQRNKGEREATCMG